MAKRKAKARQRKLSKPTSYIATLEDIERSPADRARRAAFRQGVRASWAPLWRALSEAAEVAVYAPAKARVNAAVNAVRFGRGEVFTAVFGPDSLGALILRPGEMDRQILRQEATHKVDLEDMAKQLRAANHKASKEPRPPTETLVRENLKNHPDPAPPAKPHSRTQRRDWILADFKKKNPRSSISLDPSTVERWVKRIKAEKPPSSQSTI